MKAEVGMVVCDCRFKHLRITAIHPDDDDMITLEDGHMCSFECCCDPVPHPEWEHPIDAEVLGEVR